VRTPVKQSSRDLMVTIYKHN